MSSNILITGSAGEIGCVLRAGLYDGRRKLRLLDIKPQAARPGEECVIADLADAAALREAAAGARLPELEQLEFTFHRLINRVTESRKLARFLHSATRYTPHRFYASDPAWRANMVSDHEALLGALAARDAPAARAAMERHFTDGAERLIKHLDDVGMWDKRPSQ